MIRTTTDIVTSLRREILVSKKREASAKLLTTRERHKGRRRGLATALRMVIQLQDQWRFDD